MAHQIIFTTLPLEETAFEYQQDKVTLISSEAYIPKVSMFNVKDLEFPIVTKEQGEGASGWLYRMDEETFEALNQYYRTSTTIIRKKLGVRHQGVETKAWVHILDSILDLAPVTAYPDDEYSTSSSICIQRIGRRLDYRAQILISEHQKVPKGAQLLEEVTLKGYKEYRTSYWPGSVLIAPDPEAKVKAAIYSMTQYQEEQSDWMNLSIPGFKGKINVNLRTSAKAYLTLGPELVTQAVKLREVK